MSPAKLTTEDFIRRAKEVHGDKYDYSEAAYTLGSKKIKIICPEHGAWMQVASSHMFGGGCLECGIISRTNINRFGKYDFIKKAQEIHGDQYDYSEAIYIDSKTKLTIICIEHGQFLMTPNAHTAGASGCKPCWLNKQSFSSQNINNPDKQKKLQDNFISSSSKIHSNKYNYSKVEYVNAHTKVKIVCPKHGEFLQTPKHHANDGYGCNLCGYEVGSQKHTMSAKEFYKRANEVHNNKYKYIKSEFINTATKITVICPVHGAVQQIPGNHLYHGKGCNLCGHEAASQKTLMTQKTFIARAVKAHGKKYNYDKVIYKGIEKKVRIKCPKHGYFFQLARTHIVGNGCNKCGRDETTKARRLDTATFITRSKKIHGRKYDYSLAVYGNNNEDKVIIICKDHGEFLQAPVKHLDANGCNKCQNKAEGRIAEYLFKKQIVYREYKIKNRYFDFMLPDLNLIIERDGQQHYKDVSIFSKGEKGFLAKQIKNDTYKTKIAKAEGYTLSRIPFWLSEKDVQIEIENILAGKPTYPDVPDLKQEKTRPKPKR